MTCREVFDITSTKKPDECTVSEIIALKQHGQECAACRRYFAALLTTPMQSLISKMENIKADKRIKAAKRFDKELP